MLLIYIFSVTTGILYLTLILLYLWGWRKTGIVERSTYRGQTTVSVIIAVRNEAANIPALIRALKRQDYPKNLVEVLFVDDHSTDTTKEAIHFCLKGEPGYSIIQNSGIGKNN